MNRRQWIGLRPSQKHLAGDLLHAARQAGESGWRCDVGDASLRSLGKYQAMLDAMEGSRVPKLGHVDIAIRFHSTTISQVTANTSSEAGHYFNSTSVDRIRVAVDALQTAEELTEMQKVDV